MLASHATHGAHRATAHTSTARLTLPQISNAGFVVLGVNLINYSNLSQLVARSECPQSPPDASTINAAPGLNFHYQSQSLAVTGHWQVLNFYYRWELISPR